MNNASKEPLGRPREPIRAAGILVLMTSLLASEGALGGRLEWQSHPGYRVATVSPPPAPRPGFTELSPTLTGITFSNWLAEARSLTNHVLHNGSGVALGDVDGDGWCDIYLSGLDGPNALYRNLGGWKFEEITSTAGVACPGVDATSAALVDLDGDGDLDLIVNSMGGGTFCFLNDGHGKFTDISGSCGLQSSKSRSSMAFADVNGDGLVDVYLCAYRTLPLMDMPQTAFEFKMVDGRKVIDTVNHRPVTDPEFANRFSITASGGIEEHGEGGDLYLNLGGGKFAQVSFTGGAFLDEAGHPLTARPYDWELSAMFRDVNGDGAPDLYVCNDFLSPDRLWLNDGKGHFRASPAQALRRTPHFSMGVDFGDLNRDGWDDFFVLDMLPRTHYGRMTQMPERMGGAAPPGDVFSRVQVTRNVLNLSRGDGTYADVAGFAGVEAADWAWCPMFLDVDLDGWEDLLVTNGNLQDGRHLDWVNALARLRTEKKLTPEQIFQSRRILPPLNTTNLVFRNRGNLTFEEVGASWGFNHLGVSHGMAAADLDNDGDLDLVVNNLGEGCSVYRNEAAGPRVAVRLRGSGGNTRGIGARIRLTGGAVPRQEQEIIAGGRYVSSDDPMRVFAAAGQAGAPPMRLEVFWRGGGYSRIDGVSANSIYEVSEEQAASAIPQGASRVPSPAGDGASRLFADVSERLGHVHRDDPFDDFARQPLLPWKLSQMGPGVAWIDLDGDGIEDLVIGSGRGGRTACYRSDGKGKFEPFPVIASAPTTSRDQTAIVGWPRPGTGNGRVALVGVSSYEDGLSGGGAVKAIDLASRGTADPVPGGKSSTGPLALADVDGDGILDLFVGGRVIPGRYPEPATSRLFRGMAAGKFEPDAAAATLFAGVGLVSDALFTDVDGDGDPDLVLACEWGGIRLYLNTGGSFQEATREWGLEGLQGFWTGITAVDLDEDGRLDLVASNRGGNTDYQGYRGKPIRLHFGDLSGAGGGDLVEGVYVPELGDYAPARMLDLLAKPFPFLREQFGSYDPFGKATLAAAFGERLRAGQPLEARWLESTLLLNRGGKFEPHPLPAEAQWSPAFGVAAADLDGDGHEDLILGQNEFELSLDRPRLDSGRGLLLRGDGHGGVSPVAGSVSGILAYGEARGVALADFDGDGRVDLLMTQNSAGSLLYQNRGAVPGLRIRLIGDGQNPDAIGAVIRWGKGGKLGPARELHAGGGYWSQNAVTQVIAARGGEDVLEVRWPGGKSSTRVEVPPNAHEVTLDRSGGLKVVR